MGKTSLQQESASDRKSKEFRTDRRVIYIPASSLSGLLLNLMFEVTQQKRDNFRGGTDFNPSHRQRFVCQTRLPSEKEDPNIQSQFTIR